MVSTDFEVSLYLSNPLSELEYWKLSGNEELSPWDVDKDHIIDQWICENEKIIFNTIISYKFHTDWCMIIWDHVLKRSRNLLSDIQNNQRRILKEKNIDKIREHSLKLKEIVNFGDNFLTELFPLENAVGNSDCPDIKISVFELNNVLFAIEQTYLDKIKDKEYHFDKLVKDAYPDIFKNRQLEDKNDFRYINKTGLPENLQGLEWEGKLWELAELIKGLHLSGKIKQNGEDATEETLIEMFEFLLKKAPTNFSGQAKTWIEKMPEANKFFMESVDNKYESFTAEMCVNLIKKYYKKT